LGHGIFTKDIFTVSLESHIFWWGCLLADGIKNLVICQIIKGAFLLHVFDSVNHKLNFKEFKSSSREYFLSGVG
jgi:hypothetical protein